MINITPLIPELFLLVMAIVVLMLDLFSSRRTVVVPAYVSMAAVIITGFLVFKFGGDAVRWGSNAIFVADSFSQFFKVIILGAAFLAIGSSFGTADRMTHHRGEFFALLLFSTVGMMFLVSAKELILLYVGLELTTIPLFVLVAYQKTNRASSEAGLKYLIIGAASSAILLYGLSLLYGYTGTTYLNEIAQKTAVYFLSHGFIPNAEGTTDLVGMGPAFSVALMMIIAGLTFKLAIVPFHMWAPDVYEGAPTPITAFLSVGSKAAGLAAIIRIFDGMLYAFSHDTMPNDSWGTMMAVLAAVTMVAGNIIAIRQTNIKRMLAYSSIAQAGYILIGVIAASKLGVASCGFYMFAYMFANMGAFAIVGLYAEKTGKKNISDFAGLSKTSPIIAALMTMFMLSLAGIPPLAGFMAKYYIFAAAIEAGYTWLVILALLMSVVSLYYYANVVRIMYMVDSDNKHHIIPSFPAGLVLALTGIGVLLFGILPQSILDMAYKTASSFIF
ncbi:MAG: NADH-quinone oxidoreductase subunit N [candidate division Zixibacteria bacterium]|nr:NADH-quinone oxidoreductase subunit N [candidate division Zixibacteria bacterium]